MKKSGCPGIKLQGLEMLSLIRKCGEDHDDSFGAFDEALS